MLSEVLSELQREPAVLADFARRRMPRLPAGSLLVGAGDSFIASLLASTLSSRRCTAVEPYSLQADPKLAEGRSVAFLSVSGRTAANLRAADAVRGLAARTIAVTANGSSPLAELVDERLLLPYAYRPRVPGTLSFALTALAAAMLAGLEPRCDFRRAKTAAESLEACNFSSRGVSYFLGNGHGYASALYACAKTYEFLGFRAQAQLIEEFSHMEVFALRKGDAVNLFLSDDPAGLGERLARSLRGAGRATAVLDSRGGDSLYSAFTEVFLVQRSILAEMARRDLDRPYIVRAAAKLKDSDSMIY